MIVDILFSPDARHVETFEGLINASLGFPGKNISISSRHLWRTSTSDLVNESNESRTVAS